ncbi:MAG: inner membrane CreD family protein [Victivallales bacterium]|nr:inner membrane CreD family protein [Victivallales bacterium]
MSFLKMLAIVIIFVTATVAWVILGSVTKVRTQDYSYALSNQVSNLCGSRLMQKSPIFTAITQLKQKVPSFEGTTQKTSGFWKKKIQVTKKQLSPTANKIDVDIQLEYRRKGLLWFPVYKCQFEAKYTLENPSDNLMKVKVLFEFPSNSATYDNFLLELDGKTQECQINTTTGINLEFPIKAKSKKVFRVFYKTRGLGSWTYLPESSSGGRLRDLNMTVNTDFKAIDFSDGSLAPGKLDSTKSGCRMVWTANNLITSKAIAITMPERLNPGPLVMKVTFFAPVCLLFFFVVLLATNVIKKLNIHPMHFMFTAAGFFAFNLLFAYLVDVINVHVSFLISSIVTLVLVNSYQRAALGEKFPYKWVGLAQFCYLILFSYSFFFKGLTGLTVTIGSIITLAVLMYLTRNIDWNQTFKSRWNKKIHETKNINN